MLPLSKPVSASGSLRVLAALLGYPNAQMRGYLDEMRDILHAEKALSDARRAELDALIESLANADALECEANYVELFDRGRTTSLHLFEHVHGDSRERGPAMIDLAQTYEKAGLYLAPDELPDYLPVVLEFVSTQPPREARAFLGEMAHIFNALFGALQQRESTYASVLGALKSLIPLAPLHQPHNVAGIEALTASLDDVPQVACFDTAFHRGQSRVAQSMW